MEQNNNELAVNEIKERLNILINMVSSKTEESLDSIKKVIEEPTSENMIAAMEEANSLKSQNIPYIDNIISTLNELKEITNMKHESINESIDVNEQERILNDRVSVIETLNGFLADTDKNDTSIIRKAMQTHDASDLALAVEEATKLQNANVLYANDVVSTLKKLMPVYVGKTYEEYKDDVVKQQKEEEIRKENEALEQQKEQEKLERIREQERILNDRVSAIEIANQLLNDSDKVNTDIIRSAMETHTANNMALAIEEASKLQSKNVSFAGDILSALKELMPVYVGKTYEEYKEEIDNIIKNQREESIEKENEFLEQQKRENEERKKLNDNLQKLENLSSKLSAIDANNQFLEENEKVNTDVIRKVINTRDSEDFVAAIENANVLKDKNVMYADDILSALKELMPVYVGKTYEQYKEDKEEQQKEEEIRKEKEALKQQQTEELERKNKEIIEKINSNVMAAEAYNTFLPENEKIRLDAIKKYAETKSEENKKEAIEEANAIKEKGIPYGDILLGLLNTELVQSSEQNNEEEKIENTEKPEEIIEQPIIEPIVENEINGLSNDVSVVDDENIVDQDINITEEDSKIKTLTLKDMADMYAAQRQEKEENNDSIKIDNIVSNLSDKQDVKEDLVLDDETKDDTSVSEPVEEDLGLDDDDVKSDTVIPESVEEDDLGLDDDDIKTDTVIPEPIEEENLGLDDDDIKTDTVVTEPVEEDLGLDDDIKSDTVVTEPVEEDDLGLDDDDIKTDTVIPEPVEEEDLGLDDDDIKTDTVVTEPVEEDLGLDDDDIKSDTVIPESVEEEDLGLDDDDIKTDAVVTEPVEEDLGLDDDDVKADTIVSTTGNGILTEEELSENVKKAMEIGSDASSTPSLDALEGSIDDLGLEDDDALDDSIDDTKDNTMTQSDENKNEYKELLEKITELSTKRKADEEQLTIIKDEYEDKKSKLLDSIRAISIDIEETKIVYPKFYAAYEKAADIPDYNSIVAMYDRIGEILDDEKQKEFLAAANKIVAKHVKDEADLSDINDYISKYGFAPITDEASIGIDKDKLQLQTELDDLQEKYMDKIESLQDNVDESLAKEKEIKKQMIQIRSEGSVISIDEIKKEVENDIENGSQQEVEADVEIKDSESDSLNQNVAVRSIRNILKPLYTKISSLKFKETIASAMDLIRKNPAAKLFVGITLSLGAIGIGNAVANSGKEDVNEEINTATPEQENETENVNENNEIEEDMYEGVDYNNLDDAELQDYYQGTMEVGGEEYNSDSSHIRM